MELTAIRYMGNKGLLVMIDDDTDDQEILKMAIGELDRPLHSLFFSDCESAIAHFSKSSVVSPGYVLIDLRLPRIEGDQCLQHLQRLQRFDSPQIVIYSTAIPDHWRDKLSKIGVDRFIEKTNSLQTLIEDIQELVGEG
ncbi:response regulator [Dyadobacter sp. CY261]|uniref:response regulator n=1 Tax=Dyadobacter sp. CY261 TaxID=2907203 RepID=UPI001F3B70D6|nr:response regulator [Dyadobacter sp. CY261]MCF0072861.1 response regulator [Dyadobacter sp. CY261]